MSKNRWSVAIWLRGFASQREAQNCQEIAEETDGWEVGNHSGGFEKMPETRLFCLNVFRSSDLRPAIVFGRFRMFAPAFGFCRLNDTRNVTHRERLRIFLSSETRA